MPPRCLFPRALPLSTLTTATTTTTTTTPAVTALRTLLLRPFSTTPSAQQTKTGVYRQPTLDPPIPSVQGHEPQIPAYPYGPRRVYKQANTGLYGLARIRFGNNVSEKWEVKNRRKWRPNVHRKRLWSDALAAYVQTRVTTRVLRTVDKVGGLDAYLLGSKAARVKELGPWGWRLRWRVMQTPAVRARFAEERRALGLPERTAEEERSVEEAELAAVGGTSVEGLRREIDEAVTRGDELALGDEAEAAEGEQFMREEKPKRV